MLESGDGVGEPPGGSGFDAFRTNVGCIVITSSHNLCLRGRGGSRPNLFSDIGSLLTPDPRGPRPTSPHTDTRRWPAARPARPRVPTPGRHSRRQPPRASRHAPAATVCLSFESRVPGTRPAPHGAGSSRVRCDARSPNRRFYVLPWAYLHDRPLARRTGQPALYSPLYRAARAARHPTHSSSPSVVAGTTPPSGALVPIIGAEISHTSVLRFVGPT